eukprot:jgi/Tetstr1/421541/TSEL_012488.t1
MAPHRLNSAGAALAAVSIAVAIAVTAAAARPAVPQDTGGLRSQPYLRGSRAFEPLPVGSVTPSGWLLQQLKLQAEGLSGHLAQFWPDVMDSVWIGGGGDGGLHERTPYWLNGFLPLTYLLRNANVTHVPEVRGLYKVAGGAGVSLSAQADRYLDYILSHRGADGWLGPPERGGDTYWARFPLLLALAAAAEAEPARGAEAAAAMLGHALEMGRRLPGAPLAGWSAARWPELALSLQWLLTHGVAPRSPDAAALAALLAEVAAQGEDWDSWFAALGAGFWPTGPSHRTHNVNIAMGLKSAAVAYVATGNASLCALSRARVADLDALVGLPTGMFIGDEHLPMPRTRSPSRGTELCGVVEAMFSYTTMFGVFGEPAYADRAERIAFNALPATWASPRGGDMWAHQYLQAVNEVNALAAAQPHVWQQDGPDAEMYGLEPNFGCCTANFNQGWPKLANAAVYSTPSGGVAVGLYAPLAAALPGGATLALRTAYPFADGATVEVDSPAGGLDVALRIPGWATAATVDGAPAANGTMHTVRCPAGRTALRVEFAPQVRLEAWDGGAVSVHRGALMYSLPIAGAFRTVGHHYGGPGMADDYEVTPASPWNYALVLGSEADRHDPATWLTFHDGGGPADGAAPFNHSGWPSHVIATLRRLPSWAMVHNSADQPPAAPACLDPRTREDICGPPKQVALVPHGGTDLRIGVFPVHYADDVAAQGVASAQERAPTGTAKY